MGDDVMSRYYYREVRADTIRRGDRIQSPFVADTQRFYSVTAVEHNHHGDITLVLEGDERVIFNSDAVVAREELA
jgi:hypothetical protein